MDFNHYLFGDDETFVKSSFEETIIKPFKDELFKIEEEWVEKKEDEEEGKE